MSTTTKPNGNGKAAGRAFGKQARSVADKALGAGRRAAAVNIESYERTVGTWVDFEHKVADAVEVEPLSTITTAYAELTRDIAVAQASAVRTLLRV